jgi:hypothetical protein
MAVTADSERLERIETELKRLNDGLARFAVAAEGFTRAFSAMSEEIRNIKAVPVFVEQVQEPETPTPQIKFTGRKR